MSNQPICMAEEYWANSHLSVARYYGGCTFNGKEYEIANKYGATLSELSNPASKYYVGGLHPLLQDAGALPLPRCAEEAPAGFGYGVEEDIQGTDEEVNNHRLHGLNRLEI